MKKLTELHLQSALVGSVDILIIWVQHKESFGPFLRDLQMSAKDSGQGLLFPHFRWLLGGSIPISL